MRLALCDADAPNSTVTGLVLTVMLRDPFPFSSARADGFDVVFVDQRGTSAQVLPFERSEYRNGYALFFVRLNANPSTLAEHVWIYFNKPAGADAQDIAATWTGFTGAHFDNETGRRGAAVNGRRGARRWENYGTATSGGNTLHQESRHATQRWRR
jgi:hypothetical protein